MPTDEELINKMKLCLLCRDSEDEPYTLSDAIHHYERGMHFTAKPEYKTHKSWAPMKGHKDYDLHVRYVKLLGLKKI